MLPQRSLAPRTRTSRATPNVTVLCGSEGGDDDRTGVWPADDPSLLFLLVTWPLMPHWNTVITAWGFIRGEGGIDRTRPRRAASPPSVDRA